MLATESFGSPHAAAGRNTFPGAAASAVLLVITTPRVVARRLRL